jgi:hypothetical protein
MLARTGLYRSYGEEPVVQTLRDLLTRVLVSPPELLVVL